MKISGLVYLLLLFLLTACASQSQVCAGDPPNQPVEVRQSIDLEAIGQDLGPITIEIGNQEVQVDQIVHGTICDAHWSGVVYVDCDVQVNDWERSPTFFDGCDLEIDPGTVVYVAYHNDQAYYKGCSCHYTLADQ